MTTRRHRKTDKHKPRIVIPTKYKQTSLTQHEYAYETLEIPATQEHHVLRKILLKLTKTYDNDLTEFRKDDIHFFHPCYGESINTIKKRQDHCIWFVKIYLKL